MIWNHNIFFSGGFNTALTPSGFHYGLGFGWGRPYNTYGYRVPTTTTTTYYNNNPYSRNLPQQPELVPIIPY